MVLWRQRCKCSDTLETKSQRNFQVNLQSQSSFVELWFHSGLAALEPENSYTLVQGSQNKV